MLRCDRELEWLQVWVYVCVSVFPLWMHKNATVNINLFLPISRSVQEAEVPCPARPVPRHAYPSPNAVTSSSSLTTGPTPLSSWSQWLQPRAFLTRGGAVWTPGKCMWPCYQGNGSATRQRCREGRRRGLGKHSGSHAWSQQSSPHQRCAFACTHWARWIKREWWERPSTGSTNSALKQCRWRPH